MTTTKITSEHRIYLSLTGIFFLTLVANMPTLPHEAPTLTGVVLWAGALGFCLGHLTLGVAQVIMNYIKNTSTKNY
jgi:hypothetical protein